MYRIRGRAARALAASTLAMTVLGMAGSGSALADPSSATYTVTVGAVSGYSHPDDTPAGLFIDKDGTFYVQQSHSLYGSADSRNWTFYSGSSIDTMTSNATLNNAVSSSNPLDKNADTTWRCNNSPTGLSATSAGGGSGYSQPNYCDLVGVWVDPDTGDWYGLVHNEFTPQPFGDGLHYDAIDYARSTDEGKDWTILGHAITSPYSTTRGDTSAFPNQTYDYGDGDPRLFVDQASGYFYVYYGSRIVPKGGVGGSNGGLAHVARAPIAGKMAAGTWQKWYNGAWTQPGIGGLESNMVPATSANPSGYTPVAQDYSPANTGTVDQQIAAGKLPAKSPLFIMNIAYDAYLGLYVGEPENATNSAGAQQYYVTDDLATQKWYLAGTSGSYTDQSWYRWLVDGATGTSSTIVGKSFRAYCSISCHGSSGEYANTTLTSSAPAQAPFSRGSLYRIASGDGRVLAQVSGSSTTTSTTAPTGSSLEQWYFSSDGDGSYRITNASSGQLLGVDSTTTSSRAWGTRPTVTALGPRGVSVGQEWFQVASGGGAYRLVNRYSGLVLGLASGNGGLAETTPSRFWTNTTGNAVGGTRTAAQQTLTVTVVGAAPANLDGTHVLTTSGMALDDANGSTSLGNQFITWTPSGASNQNWQFTEQPDGSYQIVNVFDGLCADDNGGGTAPGTAVIQWTCSGADNQRWIATKLASGSYTFTNERSGLLMTTASAGRGALVTQQADTGSALQQWSVS